MRQFLAIAIACISTTTVIAEECALQGRWRSDAARTLASISSSNLADASTINTLSEDLFGHMIHDWSCTEFSTWFDAQGPGEPVPYDVLESNEESITVRVSGQATFELRMEWEGECYKIPVAGHDFQEYFCRVD